MGNFTIDFFELAFLAEACIPPKPIARSMFWRNLTDKYWHQMSEEQRVHLFEWLQKNYNYEKSLINESDTQVFHARFNPDNQYMIITKYNNKTEEYRAFKMDDKYYTNHDRFISPEYIVEVNKFIPTKKY